jgi:hypothetical protein
LRNLAKRDGRDAAEYLSLYALECFLSRIPQSDYANSLVLKGGVLMAAFASRRPTRDIDLWASGFQGDIKDAENVVKSIAALPIDDGIVFQMESIHGDTIRDNADYEGVRVRLRANLTSAVIPFHIDFNFGDPIWPRPQAVELPRVLGGTVTVKGYPAVMVLAEKIVTAIERGAANTRWRDFVDISALATTETISADDLATAVATVADYRQVAIVPLISVLSIMATTAQPRWRAWRRKQHLETTVPEQFQKLLDVCIRFVDPVITGHARGMTWTPDSQEWR